MMTIVAVGSDHSGGLCRALHYERSHTTVAVMLMGAAPKRRTLADPGSACVYDNDRMEGRYHLR